MLGNGHLLKAVAPNRFLTGGGMRLENRHYRDNNSVAMKHLLLTTIAAVVLLGCGEAQQSVPAPEAKPVEPVAGDDRVAVYLGFL